MVSLPGALAGGFIGTLVLTTGLRAATELRLTRIDLPFLLGTVFTADRTRARALGYGLHFLFGLLFAGAYYLVFLALDQASWWLGSLLGVAHALFAATALVSVLLPLVHPRMGTPFSAGRFGTPSRAARFHAPQLRGEHPDRHAHNARHLRRNRRRRSGDLRSVVPVAPD